jgi:hypothetical protein
MPNTLAHIGAQGFISRPFFNNSDIKWILLGCIIPDIPWIFQRVVKFILPGINLYDLRLYSIIQSSLVYCIILSLLIALISIHYWKTFAILSVNSLLHLLLDACQIKWANGVNLFAPLNWKLTNFGLFWPESIPTYLLTAIGIFFFILVWKKGVTGEFDLKFNFPQRYTGLIILLTVYLITPLFLLNEPEEQNNHFVHTLRNYENREGKYVELDRKGYDASTNKIESLSNEEINVKGIGLDKSAVLSIKGTFTAKDTILVSEYHVHNRSLRDGTSYIGLGLIFFFWIHVLINHVRKNR